MEGFERVEKSTRWEGFQPQAGDLTILFSHSFSRHLQIFSFLSTTGWAEEQQIHWLDCVFRDTHRLLQLFLVKS